MTPAIKKAAPKKTTKSRPSSDTRQRIVATAIALFNRYGIQNVAIDHIASELRISPGNLTYHFKRKDDLIRATLDALKEELRVALERPVAVSSPHSGAEYLIRVFRTLWDTRFFFNSLAYLLTDDRRLRKEYFELHTWVIDTMESDIGYMVGRGYFRPAQAPNNFRLLSENIWGLFLNWLRLQQIETPSATTPSNQAIYDVARHLWSLCQAWMQPRFAEELLGVFQLILQPDPLEGKDVVVPTRRRRKAV